ncbi:MAG: tRNA pseudouridine(55) synthase TruB [Myxococcales bacterium]|nr:tRNA pseudouridine(55) synthase TruB [Myxococcales bacterium]
MTALPSVHGVLVVDKPAGLTSHDVVQRVRRRLGTREVGHAGTLDPMATGVLVVVVGEGTKLSTYLTAADKRYAAEVTFGRATDTLDADGTTTAEGPVPEDLEERLAAALSHERARTEQVPPVYSAIHQGGERAHAKARRGEEVILAPRTVRVLSLALDGYGAASHRAALTLHVSKGYYVRALARDLGTTLGVPSHLTALRREASGCFKVDAACPLTTADLASRLIPVRAAAALAIGEVQLTERGEADARAGRPVQPADLSAACEGPRAWVAPGGDLIAIGHLVEGVGRVLRGFRTR